ncbi:antibiotic biosynthesis monooxygenase [Clostridium sp. 19966]|uniref:putative quinol monooxygenase n=1 Tax=Clostridium sp. 19966 TaxID=2768166 RepID=UPI0028DFF944|nr:putative quinol monooxygenase [Clostridium sp. 19966]MDT8718366.1 antibiotic biosynthesis monooxygenase [Clostridium sp. 19966]
MIKVVAKNYVKEEKIEEFLKLAEELIEITRKNDEGCISYELYQDLQNKGILTMLETWENGEALKKHSQSEHFTRIVPMLSQFSEKPGETNMYNKVK